MADVAGNGGEPVTIENHGDGTADVCGAVGHATVGYRYGADGEIIRDPAGALMVHIE